MTTSMYCLYVCMYMYMCVYVYVCIYKCIYYFLLKKYFSVALFVYFQLNQSAVAGVEREPAQGTSPHPFLSRQTSHPRRGQQRNRVPGTCCPDIHVLL